jgi:hypothetical protein
MIDERHEFPTVSGHPTPDRCLHCGAKRGTEQTCVTRHLPPPHRGIPTSMFAGPQDSIGVRAREIAAQEERPSWLPTPKPEA